MTVSRTTITAGIAALSLALTASPALAKGGSGGGGGATSSAIDPSAQPWDLCPSYNTSGFQYAPDGSPLAANQYTGVGCLVVKVAGSGLSIYEIDSASGWVPDVKTSDPSKIDVIWTAPATGEKHEISIEPGKTVVR